MALHTHIMLAAFWTSKSVLWISKFAEDHLLIVQSVLILIAFSLVPASWNAWSDRFEKGHQRFLWIVVAIMFLLIPVMAYWMWHYM
jgi:hypothetical protein